MTNYGSVVQPNKPKKDSLRELNRCCQLIWYYHLTPKKTRQALEVMGYYAMQESQKHSEYALLMQYFDEYKWPVVVEKLNKLKIKYKKT